MIITVKAESGSYNITLKRNALEEVKRLNSIIAECNTLIEHLGTLWHMVNDTNFQ